MEPNPTESQKNPDPSRATRAPRPFLATAAVGAVLLFGGCGVADVAQQQVEQAADAVGQSAKAQAQKLLDEAVSALPGAQAQVSTENRAAFAELRTDLEQVNTQALDLLATPENLSAAALKPLQEQLSKLQASVQAQSAALTGITVEEQQAWADLAQSVQATADQVGFLAGLLG